MDNPGRASPFIFYVIDIDFYSLLGCKRKKKKDKRRTDTI
jgi:hypothetical protein